MPVTRTHEYPAESKDEVFVAAYVTRMTEAILTDKPPWKADQEVKYLVPGDPHEAIFKTSLRSIHIGNHADSADVKAVTGLDITFPALCALIREAGADDVKAQAFLNSLKAIER